MSEQQTQTRTRTRILRRSVALLASIIGVIALVAAVGVTVVWGHFWDFRVGNPTSDSCGTCHTMETYVDTLTNGEMLVSRHAARDIGCVDCHEVDLEQQIHETLAHLQDNYEAPLMRARYENDRCFECHEHQSYDQLAWRTTDLGVSDAQAGGHEANPHQPPHYSDLECHSCHRMHRPSTLLCWECHTYEFRFPASLQ